MTPAPVMSEVRALLLTDVVDSTQLSERLGDAAMARVWAAHDRVARDLLPRWRGREIDKTDGMLLMFEQAEDAVRYALAYHAALSSLPVPLQARAGLHVGPVILRENSAEDIALGGKPLEVDGLAKPTAARVMALARGGQTLLTPEARAALGTDAAAADPALPALHSTSHGHWVLKGLSEPVELFEVAATAAEPTWAPADSEKAYRVVLVNGRWLPVREVPNNLPEQPNAFIGRERELAEVKAKLKRARLVTLLGMGGLGKTRLSQQVAAELLAEFADGVWFLDLAPLRDGNLVLAEVAQVLGIREEPGRPLVGALGQLLKDRRVLLVVDNCEHLLKAAASLVHAILKAAPKVAILSSSRELLRVPGEQAYPILPLPLPAPSDGVQALGRCVAVRLFVERALEQRPDFELTEAEAPAVAELVARLEGIPLALELAAARLRALSVSEINRRLKNRFKLLTGGARVRDERQQTLRALVDWSYDMLTEPEQQVLQRLAVFRGGFDLAAAEAVCADDDLDADDVLDLVGSLVDKSLVGLDARDGEGRYRMLETIREYAAEKLADSDDPQAVADRHCGFFFNLSKQGRDGMQGPQQRQWLNRLDREHDNLRAAMATPQAEGSSVDPLVALKMAVALQNFWIMHGLSTEGRTVVAAMLAHPAVAALPVARAHGLYVGATLAFTQGAAREALAMLSECLALRRVSSSPLDVGTTLSTLAVTRLSIGEVDEARLAGSEAATLFATAGYRVGEAIARMQLGQVEAHAGQHDAARSHLQAALAIARAVRHPDSEGECELVLGEVDLADSRPQDAALHFERSLAVCTGAGDRRGEALARWALGRLALQTGRLDDALPSLREALVAFDGFEMRAPWIGCLEDHAEVAQQRGDGAAATALAAAAQRLRDDIQLARAPAAQQRWAQLLARLRSVMGDAAFDSAWASALLWETPQVRRQALALHQPAAPAAA